MHVTGVVIGAIPALGAMSYIQRNKDETWRISNFWAACILLMLSILMIGLFGDLISEFEELKSKGVITHGLFTELKTSGTIWVIMFPMIAGGVGINALSAYLQSRKP